VERFPELPIIFTSGYTQDSTGLPAAMRLTSYLQKPYSPTALGKLVRNVLDQHGHTTDSQGVGDFQISVDTHIPKC